MPDTTEGQKRIKSLEKNMTEVNGKLDDIQADIKEIKDCLLGDDKYKTRGMIEEHREMYDTYLQTKDVVPEISEDYKGAKWFLRNIWTILGSIAAVLVGIIYRLITE